VEQIISEEILRKFAESDIGDSTKAHEFRANSDCAAVISAGICPFCLQTERGEFRLSETQHSERVIDLKCPNCEQEYRIYEKK
jgi:hypothetical protein